MRSGVLRQNSPRYSTSRRNVGSAQCRSSKWSTIGRSRASDSSSRRTAQAISSGRASTSSSPIAPARRATTRLASSASGRSASSFARAASRVSSSSIPASGLSMIASGKYVIPSPYGTQRPSRTAARSPTTVVSSRVRRDLPAPASPRRAATRQLRASTAASNACSSSASSSERPTIGDSSRRSSPGASGAMSTTRYAGTGRDLPFSSSGGSSSTVSASRTRR